MEERLRCSSVVEGPPSMCEALGWIPSISRGERRQVSGQEAECKVSMTNMEGFPTTGVVGSETKQSWGLLLSVNHTLGKFGGFTMPVRVLFLATHEGSFSLLAQRGLSPAIARRK